MYDNTMQSKILYILALIRELEEKTKNDTESQLIIKNIYRSTAILSTVVMRDQDTIYGLSEQLGFIKSQISDRTQYVYKKHRKDFYAYFHKDDKKLEMPFCPDCYDVKQSLIHIRDTGRGYMCPKCRTSFK